MRKIKFILPVMVSLAVVALAFGNRLNTNKVERSANNRPEKPLVTTYFEFTGTTAAQYTDSTKWTKHETNPNLTCDGELVACKVQSATLSTRTQLVNFIDSNNGVINGSATIMATRD